MNRFEFFATIERYHTIQNPISEEKLDLAASYCGIKDGRRVLDVGCGKGWLARRLAKRFDIRITGLEINRSFAAEARNLAVSEGLTERIEIVQGPALDFHPDPASYDVVMCIGASFALGGFEPALDWMKRGAKPGGIVAIGEVFAKQLPLPPDVTNMPRYGECGGRSLWTTVEAMRSRGLMLRGMVESSRDDWNRYHALHWQAALDWALANPGQPDIKILTDPSGQRCDLEFDGRCIGWAIFVARNGSD